MSTFRVIFAILLGLLAVFLTVLVTGEAKAEPETVAGHPSSYEWCAASGPVTHYEVCIDYGMGCETKTFSLEELAGDRPRAKLRPRLCEPYQIKVRGVTFSETPMLPDERIADGPWSVPSDQHEALPDLNGDRYVAAPDFILLSMHFLSYGMSSFLCLSHHYGTQVIATVVERPRLVCPNGPYTLHF